MFMLGLAFAMGFIAGPGIHMVAELQPELLMQAVLYTAGAFGSFSAVSLFSERRSFLFLGGIIASLTTGMAIYALCSMFMSSAAFGIGWLMCGLFVTCLYIIFDTQIIVEQSESGYRNVAAHSLTLFLDLFKLFIEILRILKQLDEDNKKKKK